MNQNTNKIRSTSFKSCLIFFENRYLCQTGCCATLSLFQNYLIAFERYREAEKLVFDKGGKTSGERMELFHGEWNIRGAARSKRKETIQREVFKVLPLVSNGIATRFQFRLDNDFHLSLPLLGAETFSDGNGAHPYRQASTN